MVESVRFRHHLWSRSRTRLIFYLIYMMKLGKFAINLTNNLPNISAYLLFIGCSIFYNIKEL